jgi:hypothetical protein
MSFTGPGKLGLAVIGVGAFVLLCGLVPLALGYYSLQFEARQLTVATLEAFRAQPSGESLANCALASTASSNQCSEMANNFVAVVRWQSALSIFAGLVVIALGVAVRRMPRDKS